MTTLVSITNKQTFESEEIAMPSDGLAQVFIQGHVSYTGQVKVLIKGADGAFHLYPQLRFRHNGIAQVQLSAGDVIKIVFERCHSAGAEVRLLPLSTGGGGGGDEVPGTPWVDPTDGTYLLGTAEPGVTIEIDVHQDGSVDYITTADALGGWYVPIMPGLPDGTFIAVVAKNAAGSSAPAVVQVLAGGGVPAPVPYASVRVWINLTEGNAAGRTSVRSAVLDAIDKANRFKADGPEVYLGLGSAASYSTIPGVPTTHAPAILGLYDAGNPGIIQPGNTDWSELEFSFDQTWHNSYLSGRAGRVAFSDIFVTDTPLSQAAVDRIAADIAASDAVIDPSISPLRTVYMIQVDTSDTATSAVIDNTPVDGIPVIAGSDTAALTKAILAAIYPAADFVGEGDYAGRYMFATYQGNPNVRTYDTLAMEQRKDGTFLAIGGIARRSAISPDGTTLAIALDRSPGVTLRDPLTGAVLNGGQPSLGKAASDAAWSPDGSMLAVAVADGSTVHVFSTADWTTLASLTVPSRTNSRLAWSPDGSFLAVGGSSSSAPGVTVFEAPSWTQVLDVTVGLNVPWANERRAFPAFSRDGQYLACVSYSVADTVVYRTSDWSEVGGLNLGSGGATRHPYGAQDVLFTDGHLVIATNDAPYLTRYTTWDWGLTAGVAATPGGPATALALSRDGGTLAISAGPNEGGGIVAFYDTGSWSRSTYAGVQAPSGASNLSI